MFLYRDTKLPRDKEIRAGLSRIFGVGKYKANYIVCKLGLKYPYFINNLNNYKINVLLFLLQGLVISDAKIKKIITDNINKLIITKSYKGIRHLMCLPVKGQRTRTNAQTQKKKRIYKRNLVEDEI